MNMQDRLKAARAANGKFVKAEESPTPPEPAPMPEQPLEPVAPVPKAQPKNLELDPASQQLLEENPIVPDAGKPAIQTPKANSKVEPEKTSARGINPFVVLGGVLAAGLLLMGGVALSQRGAAKPVNPMPNDKAPVPVSNPPVQRNNLRVVEV